MIDIHTHILPGIDDGAKDIEESIEMARLASEKGIRHIFATCHYNMLYNNNKTEILNKTKELQSMVDKLNIKVTIYPANEVSIYNSNFFYEHAEQDCFLYLDKLKRFILLEQPWDHYNSDSLEIVRWLRQRGTTPIIAHPERHEFFREDPSLLLRLIDEGAWTQVSVDSLNGKNNKFAQAYSFDLLEQDLVHTIASDAHNVERNLNLLEGFRLIEARMGQSRADEIKQRLQKILK